MVAKKNAIVAKKASPKTSPESLPEKKCIVVAKPISPEPLVENMVAKNVYQYSNPTKWM
jgi:hypothetical protein